MAELRWLLAYSPIMVAGSIVLQIVADDWPTSAQIAFLVALLGFALTLLMLGRERTRRAPRTPR